LAAPPSIPTAQRRLRINHRRWALQLGLVVTPPRLAHVERMEGITVYWPVIWRPSAVVAVVLASASSLALADGAAVAGAAAAMASLGAGGAR
jgi:hypothetical protein